MDWKAELKRAGFHSIAESRVPGDDIRKAVLAENITIRPQEIRFTFLCPNCGHRHWAIEIDGEGAAAFSTIAWTLTCGDVRVRMPWAQTPAEDLESVYGDSRADVEVA